MNNKIELDYFFTNITLLSDDFQHYLELFDDRFKYVQIAQILYNEDKKEENKYEISVIKKENVSSLDIFTYTDNDNILIIRLSISGRNEDISFPFKEEKIEQAYKVFDKLEKWLFNLK